MFNYNFKPQSIPRRKLLIATTSLFPINHANSKEIKQLHETIKDVVTKQKSPVALRLVFHDAFTYDLKTNTGGLNASIQYELDRPDNAGLKRGWHLVEVVKDTLKGTNLENVSCADIIALLGAQAVTKCGGPIIDVSLGRIDTNKADPDGRLPDLKSTAKELKDNFASKGFSVKELVVLSGAHTLGSKGYGDPYTFDNAYYKELLKKPWNDKNNSMASMIGIPTDHVLPEDEECLPYIYMYAHDQNMFFKDFSEAYKKMVNLGLQ